MLRRRRFGTPFESLELRQMLAADIGIQLLAPFELIPGEPASYAVKVTNQGSDKANSAVTIQTTEHLEDVMWTRETTIGSDLLASDKGNPIHREGVELGDIDGDGFGDVYFNEAVYFGTASGAIDVDTQVGENGFSLPLGPFGWRAVVAGGGDINGDDIDDFVVGAPSKSPHGVVYVIYGSVDRDFGTSRQADIPVLNPEQLDAADQTASPAKASLQYKRV